jgi:hypothetical protein
MGMAPGRSLSPIEYRKEAVPIEHIAGELARVVLDGPKSSR